MEWTSEKPADDILLVLYAGADASFTLYEDDGLTYGYEKGAYSTIGLEWDDASRTFTIGERKGSFPGMLQTRRFRVVVADREHPFAYDPSAAGVAVDYDGNTCTVTL
jgi:alpha-D-xyloside xylohydrolase